MTATPYVVALSHAFRNDATRTLRVREPEAAGLGMDRIALD